MPLVRHHLRSEHALGDPALYAAAAARDDAGGVLEGVAVAGLVGVLRQLGDLAEFSVELFNNLHEDVMATAARGRGLAVRVQQLDTDFRTVENAYISQTSPSDLAYSAGIDWHPNLQIDCNHITRGDMPRFIFNSYEECSSPPRLFLLDKFDTAGPGACLKRYSDPSSFRRNFVSSIERIPGLQTRKKSCKIKIQGQVLRNAEPSHSFTTNGIISRCLHKVKEEIHENDHVRRVKLKRRPLSNINTALGRSPWHVIERYSPDEYTLCEKSSIDISNMECTDSGGFAHEVHEGVINVQSNEASNGEGNNQSPSDQQTMEQQTDILKKQVVKEKIAEPSQRSGEEKHFLLTSENGVPVESLNCDSSRNYQTEICNAKKEEKDAPAAVDMYFSDAIDQIDGSSDSYISADVASDLDSYIDALTTMESEIETDNDRKVKREPGFPNRNPKNMDSEATEGQQIILSESSSLHDVDNSTNGMTWNILTNKRRPGHSIGNSLEYLSHRQSHQGNENHDLPFDISQIDISISSSIHMSHCSGGTQDMTPTMRRNIIKEVSSENILYNETVSSDLPDMPTVNSEFGDASCSSCGTGQAFFPTYINHQSGSEKLQSRIEISKKMYPNCAKANRCHRQSDGNFSSQECLAEINISVSDIGDSSGNHIQCFEPTIQHLSTGVSALRAENVVAVNEKSECTGTGAVLDNVNELAAREDSVFESPQKEDDETDLVSCKHSNSLLPNHVLHAKQLYHDRTCLNSADCSEVHDGKDITVQSYLSDHLASSNSHVDLASACFVGDQHNPDTIKTHNPDNLDMSSTQIESGFGIHIQQGYKSTSDSEAYVPQMQQVCTVNNRRMSEPEVSINIVSNHNLFDTLESMLLQSHPDFCQSPLRKVSCTRLPPFPSFCLPTAKACDNQSSEATGNMELFGFPSQSSDALKASTEEAPPLPPLPPVEWRVGKLPVSSPMPDGMMLNLPIKSTNLQPVAESSHEFLKEENAHLLNTFASVSKLENGSQPYYIHSEGAVLPCAPSGKLPMIENERCCGGIVSASNDDGSFGLSPNSDRESVHSLKSSLLVPTFGNDYLSDPISQKGLMQPIHNHLVESTIGVHVDGHTLPLFACKTDDTTENKPSGKVHSRDPLIEAVASHDKSTLREVPEAMRNMTRAKAEQRSALLEQIRNKAFVLKPVAVMRPNFKEPVTNLKVAAMLEKASMIRQALVGSDEEDNDSWE